jgi:hypothetical protein
MWPAMMVRQLIEVLPASYFAEPNVYLRTTYEVDIGTFRDLGAEAPGVEAGEGGVAVATYAPPRPTLSLEPQLPDRDVYRVRIYDSRRHRRLVAAIEIASPSNKDRPESRGAFVTKVAELLKQDICVSIVDVVSNSDFNLYADLLRYIDCDDPALGDEPPPMYAVTLRARPEGSHRMMDCWYHPLVIGEALPTLPIWLNLKQAVPLVLESSYEETCRTLRIR